MFSSRPWQVVILLLSYIIWATIACWVCTLEAFEVSREVGIKLNYTKKHRCTPLQNNPKPGSETVKRRKLYDGSKDAEWNDTITSFKLFKPEIARK